jgi:hypothetical protein
MEYILSSFGTVCGAGEISAAESFSNLHSEDNYTEVGFGQDIY